MVTLRKDVQYGHYFNEQGVRIVERDYDPNELLSSPQVAELLGVSAPLVRQWLREGTLPARKIGNSWVIRRADAELMRDRPSPGRPSKT